jgi:hypothetical protein
MLAHNDQPAAGRPRRRRPVALRVASVAATAGLMTGVLAACADPSAPGPTGQGSARTSQTPTPATQPTVAREASHPPAAPELSAAVADGGMPRYYIVDSDPTLAPLPVRSSLTGKVVSTVSPPAGCDPKTVKITAAANDRDFVLGCLTRKIVLYRFQVSPTGQVSALTPLPTSPSDGFLDGLALNADGSKLAIGLQGPGAVEVETLATGTVRTWTGASPFDLAWADGGRELSFTAGSRLYALDVNTPGNSLHGARLILPRTVQSDSVEDAVLSPDGTTIIASVEYNNLGPKLNRNSVVGGIIEISATNGKLVRTLLAEHAHYSVDGGGNEAGWYQAPCGLGQLDATGNHLLVSCDQFGRLDRGRFTPIPGPGPLEGLYTAAW